MRSVTTSICVAFVLVIGGARLGGLLAQTAPEPQTHYKHGQGYQHSFEDAEKWAKAFDDPARDAWQKPDEVLNALHLQRTDRVADLGAGTGYFSVRIARSYPKESYFPLISNRKCSVTFVSVRTMKISAYWFRYWQAPRAPIFPSQWTSFLLLTHTTISTTALRTFPN